MKVIRHYKQIVECLAGCTLLSWSVIVVLPSGSDILKQQVLTEKQKYYSFPLSNLLLMIGFILSALFIKLFPYLRGRKQKHKNLSKKESQTDIELKDFHLQATDEEIIRNNNQKCVKQCQKQQIRANKNNYIQDIKNQQVNHKMNFFIENQQQQLIFKIINIILQRFIRFYFNAFFQSMTIGGLNSLAEISVILLITTFCNFILAMQIIEEMHQSNRKILFVFAVIQIIIINLSFFIGRLIIMRGLICASIILLISAGTFLFDSVIFQLRFSFRHHQNIKLKFSILVASTVFMAGIKFYQTSIGNQLTKL